MTTSHLEKWNQLRLEWMELLLLETTWESNEPISLNSCSQFTHFPSNLEGVTLFPIQQVFMFKQGGTSPLNSSQLGEPNQTGPMPGLSCIQPCGKSGKPIQCFFGLMVGNHIQAHSSSPWVEMSVVNWVVESVDWTVVDSVVSWVVSVWIWETRNTFQMIIHKKETNSCVSRLLNLWAAICSPWVEDSVVAWVVEAVVSVSGIEGTCASETVNLVLIKNTFAQLEKMWAQTLCCCSSLYSNCRIHQII